MKKVATMAAGLTLATIVALGTSTMQAAMVVNFDAPGGINSAANYVGLGAYPDAPGNTYWNPITNGGATSGNVTSSGSSINVTLTMSSANSFGSQQFYSGTQALFYPWYYVPSGSITITLNNVPNGSDLYMYGSNGEFGGRGTLFTVGSTTLSTDNTDQSSNINTSFVAGLNYVEFTNVPVSNGMVTITATGNPNTLTPGNTEADFNGLQLVVSVPEPTSLALGLVGMGLMLLRRSRKQEC